MPRYYHVENRNEHSEPGPGIVELPEDNPFWQPLPPGHRLTYDADNLPNGTEPVPPPAAGTDAAMRMSMSENDIRPNRIVMALMRSHNGNSNAIDSINAKLGQIAQNHSTTVEHLMSLLDEW